MESVALGQESDWPDDAEWRRRFPSWFAQSFDGHTREQLLADPTLWDFGSWLDAIRHPGWAWWSSEVSAGGGIVRCSAYADPFAIEPLMYLLRVAGVESLEFREE